MKRILLISLLLFYISSFSQIPTKGEMKSVAINFYNLLNHSNKSINDIKKIKENSLNNVLTYSVFVFNNNDWVIVSANKQADPILAYSKEHNYSDFVAPAAKSWLAMYDYYVYNITNKNIKNDETDIDYTEQWNNLINNKLSNYNTEKATVHVEPLLSTKWGQTTSNTGNDANAYNYYAPNGDDCSHSYAGCPAVAIGQVIRYWQYPDCDIFDYNKMPNTLDVSNSNYYEQKKEIANLFRNIGDNISNYTYSCDVSGAMPGDIYFALKDELGFNNVQLIDRDDYNRNEWKDKLCNELDNNRPILYAGYDSYSNQYGCVGNGHIYVCDGWEKPLIGKRFHFNMGWNGDSDGFYKFDDIPEHYHFCLKAFISLYPIANCNSTLNITQFDKYIPFSQYKYYNPIAGTIHSNNVTIEDNETVHYKAYNEIILENFETEDDAEFIAEIIPCPTNCNFTNYKDLSKTDYYNLSNQDKLYNSEQENNIIVYPNPNNGIFTIHNNTNIKKGTISIYNCLGSIVYETNFTETDLNIDLSNNTNGVYILKYTSDEFNSLTKIIKR